MFVDTLTAVNITSLHRTITAIQGNVEHRP
jgi:hypothetical protein